MVHDLGKREAGKRLVGHTGKCVGGDGDISERRAASTSGLADGTPVFGEVGAKLGGGGTGSRLARASRWSARSHGGGPSRLECAVNRRHARLRASRGRRTARHAGLHAGRGSRPVRHGGLLLVAHEHQDERDSARGEKGRGAERRVVAGKRALHSREVGGGARHSRGDRHEQGRAEGGRHLVDRVGGGLGVLNRLVGKRVHAPGVDRRHRELDADGEHRVHHRDQKDGRIGTELGEAQHAAQDDSGTDEHGHADAELVEQTPRQHARKRADEGTRQKGESAYRGALAKHALDVERHDGLHADEGGLEEGDDDDDGAVVGRLKDVDAQHRFGKVELAICVETDKRDACDDETDRKAEVGGRTDRRQAIEQADEAAGRKHDGQQVKLRALELAVRLEHLCSAGNDDCRDDGDNDENRAPAHRVDQHARKGGADGGREANDEADDAHGAAAALTWDDKQDDAEHHGHHEARGTSLHHAAQKQQREHRGNSRDKAASRKERHAANEKLACGQAAHEICRKGNDDGLGKSIARGKPLHSCGGKSHICHNGRQSRREQRSVKHRDKRACKQHHYHLQLVFCKS